MKTKKFISLLILNYSYNAKSFTTIEDIESKHLLQLEQENSELIEGTHLGFMPGSFHLSFFVFCQIWRQSYQNQLSFSGKDSTADFFVFCQNER